MQQEIIKRDCYWVFLDAWYTHIRSPGAAFGIFSKLDLSYRVPVLLFISFMALLLIEYLLVKSHKDHWMVRLALSLVTGGALGNFYESLIYGEVADSLDFYLGNYHWPTFNLADVFISSGIGFILLITVLRGAGWKNLQARKRW